MHSSPSSKSQKKDLRLLSVMKELEQREPIFHRTELGTTRADFENMMVQDYWEVGASGRIYDREFVLDVLEKRDSNLVPEVWQTRDFCCREIVPDNYLLTYTLIQGDRVTRRATIWRWTPQGWKILYHQGTIVQEP